MNLSDLKPSDFIELDRRLPANPIECLQPTIEAFKANNVRWQSHKKIAEAAALRGMQYERALRRVLWNRFGRPFDLATDTYEEGSVYKAIDAEIRRGAKFEGQPEQVSMIMPSWTLVFGDKDGGLMEGPIYSTDDTGGDPIELHMGLVPPADTKQSLDVMFESQIVSAWTMFESLAGDLWVDAVNAVPQPLALLNGCVHRIKNKIVTPEDDAKSQKQPNAKRYAPEELFSLTETFDVSKLMGDFYRDNERVSFISLRRIRQAYSSAFSIDNDQIDDALSMTELDNLALTRNAIVHAAGKADGAYVKGHKYLPDVPFEGPEKKIPLDGTSTNKLILSVVESCTKLINAVDHWLRAHQNSRPATT
jgi:hypothetical protein